MIKEFICPDCGQVAMLDVNDDLILSEEESQAIALKNCKCPAGRKVRAQIAQREEAKQNIQELCGAGAEANGMTPINCDGIFEILNNTIDLISAGKIFNLSVGVSNGGTVKISVGTKGQIKVKRTVGFSEPLDANQKW